VGDLDQPCELFATNVLFASMVHDTMSSGWFIAPSSATVRPTTFVSGATILEVAKCTTGVHV